MRHVRADDLQPLSSMDARPRAAGWTADRHALSESWRASSDAHMGTRWAPGPEGFAKVCETAEVGKWTRSQPIRTAAQIPLHFSLLEIRDPFPYQAISARAQRLRRLGMSAASIARALGVTDKTVAKAIRWMVSAHTDTNREMPEKA